MIPAHWFHETPILGIRLRFCRTNEVESRKFLTCTPNQNTMLSRDICTRFGR